MAAVKTRLSRKYVYARLANLNVDLSQATLHKVALMEDPTQEPSDESPNDWLDGIVVTQGHDLYRPEIGPAIAILIGPDRGDTVDTTDKPAGKYMMWTDWKVSGSDERHAEWHGPVEVVTAPGGF